jgi:hypothetical protein
MPLICVAFAGMKGLRRILTRERSLRRSMQPSVPPKEDEADQALTSAWGLIVAAQVPGDNQSQR